MQECACEYACVSYVFHHTWRVLCIDIKKSLQAVVAPVLTRACRSGMTMDPSMGGPPPDFANMDPSMMNEMMGNPMIQVFTILSVPLSLCLSVSLSLSLCLPPVFVSLYTQHE